MLARRIRSHFRRPNQRITATLGDKRVQDGRVSTMPTEKSDDDRKPDEGLLRMLKMRPKLNEDLKPGKTRNPRRKSTDNKKKWPPSLVMRSDYFPHFLSMGLGVDRVWLLTFTVFGPGFFPVRSGRQMTLFAMPHSPPFWSCCPRVQATMIQPRKADGDRRDGIQIP
jgi:hypothetical protein